MESQYWKPLNGTVRKFTERGIDFAAERVRFYLPAYHHWTGSLSCAWKNGWIVRHNGAVVDGTDPYGDQWGAKSVAYPTFKDVLSAYSATNLSDTELGWIASRAVPNQHNQQENNHETH